jgi:uncharacterized protein (DUF849 family)
MLKAALNGTRGRGEHPAVPLTLDDLVADAAACVAAGAAAIHLHPRDATTGRETLDAATVDAVAAAVRDRCGVPVGVSTGAWIEPDPARRAALVATWGAPDFASVNLSESGAAAVMRALLDAGIGVEAGVWTPADAERLAATGLQDRVLRVLIELIDVPAAEVPEAATAINTMLDHHGSTALRLQHGEGDAAWPALRDAVARGLGTRIGLEDTLRLPDGSLAPGNAALVRAARGLGAS